MAGVEGRAARSNRIAEIRIARVEIRAVARPLGGLRVTYYARCVGRYPKKLGKIAAAPILNNINNTNSVIVTPQAAVELTL
jgi:hypothetical protein